MVLEADDRKDKGMGHGITVDDRMFSTLEVEGERAIPWHINETGERVTLFESYPGREDAMHAAGHDFNVIELPFRVETPFGTGPQIDGWKVLAREDNPSKVMQVAKDTYTVVQNSAGWDIIEALLETNDGIRYETGGTLHEGAKCWVSARLPEGWMVTGDNSPIVPFIAVVWSHDGSIGIKARSTCVRIVCANTEGMSELDAQRRGTEFSFRHTQRVAERIEDAKAVLKGVRGEFSKFIELAEELATIKLTPNQREIFVTKFIPAPPETLISGRVMTNIEEARSLVRWILDTSRTVPDEHRFTAYGAVQAGVEYLDHLRGFRSHGTHLGRTLLRAEPLKSRLIPLVKACANG